MAAARGDRADTEADGGSARQSGSPAAAASAAPMANNELRLLEAEWVEMDELEEVLALGVDRLESGADALEK